MPEKTHPARLVSLLLPVYNSAETISDTIKSILRQSWSQFELWVLDDGSTDRTSEIVQGFQDPRIHWVSDGKNMGRSCRLNQGIDFATGAYIARIDGDDLLMADRLEKQLLFLEAHPEIQVAGSWAVAFDFQNAPTGMMHSSVPASLHELAVRGSCFIHPSVTARADWFRQHRYDEDYFRCEDFELWLRTYSKKHFYIAPEPLIFYRNTGIQPLWKYQEGYKEMKQAILKHRDKVGFYTQLAVWAKAKLRVVLYPLLVRLKKLNPLYPLTSEQQQKFHREIEAIQQFPNC